MPLKGWEALGMNAYLSTLDTPSVLLFVVGPRAVRDDAGLQLSK